MLASYCLLTLLPLVVEAVITEAVLGGAGAPSSGGAAGGHPGHEHEVTTYDPLYSLTLRHI